MAIDLQEVISRGRFIFHGAPQRLEAYRLFNGKRSLNDIAEAMGRQLSSVTRDSTKILNSGLIEPATNRDGSPLKKGRSPVYQKIALARTVGLKYFTDRKSAIGPPTAEKKAGKAPAKGKRQAKREQLPIPDENAIIDICSNGEDQLHEFKAAGTDMSKVAKEIAGMLNTKAGGLVFYGVDDKGGIIGSDLSRQDLDQRLQNSIRNKIVPAPAVQLREVTVMGAPVIVVAVPPWNRRDVYHFDDRALLRRGSNTFPARADENKKLHNGETIT